MKIIKKIFYSFFVLLFSISTLVALKVPMVKAALVGNTTNATLTFLPQTGSYAVNNVFQVVINVDTHSQNVNTVAAIISYNASLFNVTIDSTGSLFSMQAEGTVANGKIRIVRGSTTSINTAAGRVAALNITPLTATSPSSDNFTFDFVAGDANQSNVFLADANGTAVLSGVYNGRYTITGGVADTVAPTVTAFAVPSTSNSLSVAISSFTATDNTAVTGYIITESANTPSALTSGWSTSIPTSYTCSSAGAKTLYAWAKDASGNVSASRSASVTVTASTDTTAPIISSVSSTGITQNSAAIAWSTNEAADTQVDYGLTTSYGSQTTLAASMITAHSQTLTNLSPTTTYHYRVRSKDAAGNQALSVDATFLTLTGTNTSAPVISNGFPSGELAAGTTQANISFGTDKNATCRWSTTANQSYSTMTNTFTGTGSTNHSIVMTGLSNGTTYTYYVKCTDITTNANNTNTADYVISFSIASLTTPTPTPTSTPTPTPTPTSNPSPTPTPYTCPTLATNQPGWCTDGTEVFDGLDEHGCRRPPRCVPKPTNCLPEGSLIKLPDDPKIYIIVNCTRKWIQSAAEFEQGGYSWSNIQEVTPTVIETLQKFEEITGLLKSIDSERIYRIISGHKLWIPSPSVFNAQGLDWNSVQQAQPEEVNQYPRAKLLQAAGDAKVYYITESGLKRHVPTINVFNSYNNTWEEVIKVTPTEINSFTDNALIKLESDAKVYKLEGNTKRWITSASAFNRLRFDWTKIAPINLTEFNYYQLGSNIN